MGSVVIIDGFLETGFDWLARIAGANHFFRHGASDNRTSGDDCESADVDVGGEERLGADPGAIFNDDLSITVRKIWQAVVVIAAAEEGPLRDAAMGTNTARLEIEDENLFADPGKMTNGKFPRKVDVDARFDDHPLSNLSSKKAEKEGFKPVWPRQGGEEEEALKEVPDGFDTTGPSAVETFGWVEEVEALERIHWWQ